MTIRRLALFLFFPAILTVLASCGGTRNIATIANIKPVKVPVNLSSVSLAKVSYITDNELDKRRINLSDTISVIGVGDMMLGTNFPDDSYLPPNEGKNLLKDVRDILSSADITFGNLEGVILNEGGDQKKCNDPSICYIFRSPDFLAQRFVEAGFDVMSTANNHAGDFGTPGRLNTQRVLDSLDIFHAGQQNTPYVFFPKDNLIYGFAAFSPNTGTMSINDIEQAAAIVAHLDSLADIVIVSFHGGAEGTDYQYVTRENELFYGENRGNVYAFSHAMIDAGADILFGHGPHVTRAIEVYKNRFIAYSLGNFCTYARFNLRGPNGLAPIINVKVAPDGTFLYGEITPVIQRGEGGPEIDEQGRVIKIIQQLIEKDFPESLVTVDETGRIDYLQKEL